MLDEMSLQLFEGIAAGRGEDAAHWSGVMDEGAVSLSAGQGARLGG